MDSERALERFGGDRPFLMEMSQDLVKGLPQRIEELKIALNTKNANDFTRHAHNMKGVSANFSADPITKLSAELEALGRGDDLASAPGILASLELEAERLVKFLKESGITS